MLAETDLPGFLERMHQRSQRLARGLVERLGARTARVRVKVGEDLLARDEVWCAFVESGVLRFVHAARSLRLLGAGDLFLADSHSGLGDARIESCCACDLRVLSRMDLIGALSDSPDLLHPWLEWVSIEHHLACVLATRQLPLESPQPPPHPPRLVVRRFEEGEQIVGPGETARELLEVLEGSIVEERDGEVVRLVGPGELAGELAALCDVPGPTALRAAAPCVVRALPRDELLELGRDRPRVWLALAERLAQRVARCELEHPSGGQAVRAELRSPASPRGITPAHDSGAPPATHRPR